MSSQVLRGPAGLELGGGGVGRDWVTTRLKQVSRGTVWLARVLTTEAREPITCAELALSGVQDEGVGSHAEVTSALSQGEMGGRAESHDTRALGGAWCPRL